MISCLQRGFKEEWQNQWKTNVNITNKGKHASAIKESIGNYNILLRKSRKKQIVLARMIIGHIRTNSYLYRFNIKDSPLCSNCLCEENLEHVILTCT